MFKKIFLFLFFLINTLCANVVMHSPGKFYAGEPVIFSLEAFGNDIEFPVINDIAGLSVQKNGSSSSISIINGKRTQKILQQYRFFPDSTIIIPKFKVIIDGKEYFTQQKEIHRIEVKKTQSKYIDFTLSTSKKNLYVGEQTLFTLIFKYRKDLQVVDLGFTAPSFQNFWSKQIGQPKKYDEGMFVVQELNYILFPQKSGKIKIPALKVDVSLVDSRNNGMSFFGPPTRLEKVYSNELEFDIKPIPENVLLIGDFKLTHNVNKKLINAGEALTFDIQIEGRGNLDDIPEIKLDIPNATIYDNDAIKTFDMVDGKYGGVYKKSFSIVANEDIIIPEVTIKYFDNKSDKIKALKTNEYKIEVKQKVNNELQLYKQQPKEVIKPQEVIKVVHASGNEKLLYFFFGIIFSVLIFGLILYVIKVKGKKSQEELPLEKEIKNAHSLNALLNLLLCYINQDVNLDKMIYSIENDKSVNLKQIKKDIIKIVKEKDIK